MIFKLLIYFFWHNGPHCRSNIKSLLTFFNLYKHYSFHYLKLVQKIMVLGFDWSNNDEEFTGRISSIHT